MGCERCLENGQRWLIRLALGILIGLAGLFLLRRSGSSWRVGRLLAAAPRRTLAEAAEMAGRGEERYVRLHGRIDSDEEFPDDDGQPDGHFCRRHGPC